jgi:hypothetical protein
MEPLEHLPVHEAFKGLRILWHTTREEASYFVDETTRKLRLDTARNAVRNFLP